MLESKLTEATPDGVIGQIEGTEQSTSSHVADELREFCLELAEPLQEMRPHPADVVQKVVFVDDFQVAGGAYHIDQIASPGGVDATRHVEDVLGFGLDPLGDEDAADLHLFAEDQDIGGDAELLMRPHGAGEPNPGLDLVEDEQCVVLISQLP